MEKFVRCRIDSSVQPVLLIVNSNHTLVERNLIRSFTTIQLERYETIFETLTDAVYVFDENGRFTYVNKEFIELVGYEQEIIIGNTPSLIKDEETVEIAERYLTRLLSEDGPETVTFEAVIQPRDGDPIVCEDNMGVLPYEGDSFTGPVGTLRDVTERKERTRELERQNERLDEFMSVVSHDLRNPLIVAEGEIELAQAETECANLNRAANAIGRCQALIDDLSTLARSGDTIGSKEPVPVSVLAEECWQVVPGDEATLTLNAKQTISSMQATQLAKTERALDCGLSSKSPTLTVGTFKSLAGTAMAHGSRSLG